MTTGEAGSSSSGIVSPVLTRADAWSILLLTLVSAAMAAALWGKLQTLLYLDPSWWLQEIARAARGELPYRDFAWHFPPFAVLLYGYALRVFGIRFEVVQIVMDVVSLAIVVLSYALLRHYVSTLLALLTCLLLIAVCCTTLTYFSLFSLFGYSPALQTGTLGLLLLLNGVVGHRRITVAAAGAFIALLSKPEPIVATVGILFVVVAFDPRRSVKQAALLLAVCFAPALLVYAFFANAVGLSALAAAITGYGLATNTCPWWPTGIGIWAGIAGCGAASVLVALGSASRRDAWRLWSAAIPGLAFYLSYEIFEHGWNAQNLIRSMASTTDVFRAALWPGILYWAYLLGRGIRGYGEYKKLLLLTAPVLMSARSLFGTVLTPFPEVPAICYPFVILIGPFLLYQALSAQGDPVTKRSALRFVAALVICYIAVRIAGGYPEILSSSHYSQIQTVAGPIKVSDGGASAEIYDYVMEHTTPTQGILELPYGGGIGFATGRRSPTYSTLFVQLSPTESVQRSDVERMRAAPPAIVIARDDARFGTYYGVEQPVGCEFPRIVWKSAKRAGDPNRILPIVDYIRANYHVERRIGSWQILMRGALPYGR